jgi:hypothetical protein
MGRRVPTHPRIEHRLSDHQAIVLDSTESSPELTKKFDAAAEVTLKKIKEMLREMGFKIDDAG